MPANYPDDPAPPPAPSGEAPTKLNVTGSARKSLQPPWTGAGKPSSANSGNL